MYRYTVTSRAAYVQRANSPLNRVYFLNDDVSEKKTGMCSAHTRLFGGPKRV